MAETSDARSANTAETCGAFSRITAVSPSPKYRYCVEAGRAGDVLYHSFHGRIEDAWETADRMRAAYAEIDRSESTDDTRKG